MGWVKNFQRIWVDYDNNDALQISFEEPTRKRLKSLPPIKPAQKPKNIICERIIKAIHYNKLKFEFLYILKYCKIILYCFPFNWTTTVCYVSIQLISLFFVRLNNYGTPVAFFFFRQYKRCFRQIIFHASWFQLSQSFR